MSENTTQNMDVAAKNAGTEEVAGTAIAKAAETAVAEVKPNGAAYITTLLNNTFEEFHPLVVKILLLQCKRRLRP